jgi:CRISPR-associated protein Csd1
MNWIQSLHETYKNCQTNIGYVSGAPRPLLPICHITVQAHIEVVIDGNGNFRRAGLVERDDSTTIIPATESSASRSGKKPECHPLIDKLQYLAGDFADYGGVVTSGFSGDPSQPYRNFVDLLTQWCRSPHSDPKARAVLEYVQKKKLMQDLVAQKVLLIGDDKQLLSKENINRDKNTKDIFSVINSTQDNAVVRWVVESPESDEHRVWLDKGLWESWAGHYLNSRKDAGMCLATGQNRLLTTNHPKYTRREGDGAKLISSNDKSGFTFRGRFITDEQACGVGLETSQKAHYALAWLISRQGYSQGDLAIVAWATSGAKIIQPTDDPIAALDEDVPGEETQKVDTAQEVALRLKKKISGYRKEIGDRTNVVVMAVDSATTGRLAIVYYRMLNGSDFLNRIERWHESCAWLHSYWYDKKQERYVPFIGAPAPADIAEAAYGSRLDDLKKATIKRLLPCIIEGQPIPRDLVESAVRRASNRIGIKNPDDKKYRRDEEYTWKKTLSIACALFKKSKEGKEKYEMSLDETRPTRDYLYGRLLALADNLESWALRDANEQRETSAARLMQRFAEHPFSTWRQIELSLRPYIARLGGKSIFLQREIDKVVDMFNAQDFMKDTRLSGEFLLGYHSQREALRQKRSSQSENEASVPNSNN